MNAETKRQAVGSGALVAVVAGLVVVGAKYSQSLIAPPVPTITLEWNVNETAPGVTTEIWASTNLVNWTLRTNVSGTNRVTLPRDKAAEFFKVRNSLDGRKSDWSRNK